MCVFAYLLATNIILSGGISTYFNSLLKGETPPPHSLVNIEVEFEISQGQKSASTARTPSSRNPGCIDRFGGRP